MLLRFVIFVLDRRITCDGFAEPHRLNDYFSSMALACWHPSFRLLKEFDGPLGFYAPRDLIIVILGLYFT